MTAMHRAALTFVGVLALLVVLAAPVGAQVGKLLGPNAATESELAQLPFMTPAIVKATNLPPEPAKVEFALRARASNF
jgi:hypothetical protein